MKYFFVFLRLTLKGLFSSYYFYLSAAVMAGMFYLVLAQLGPALADARVAPLAAGQLVYATISTGMIFVFLFVNRVYIAEKSEGTIIPLLCSPAGVGELLLGKAAGVTAAAMAGSALSLLAPLAAFPATFRAMFSPEVLAAFVIVSGVIFSYSALVGMLLLCTGNVKVVYPALFFLNYVPVAVNKYVKGYIEANGLGGANLMHLVSLAALLLLTGAVYKLYFSKQRVAASV